MTTLLIVSAAALIAAGLIVLSRLHLHRDFEELVQAIRAVGMATRDSFERATKPQDPPGLKNWPDLAVFLWNSRLFVQMSNQVRVSDPENKEVKCVSEDLALHHKLLRKLVALSFGEKAMGFLLAIPVGYYQNRAIVCYAEAADLVYYIVSYWRPQSESALGEKL